MGKSLIDEQLLVHVHLEGRQGGATEVGLGPEDRAEEWVGL